MSESSTDDLERKTRIGKASITRTIKPPRIFTPSLGPADWRIGLADPFLHWRRAKSAWEVAVSWESRRNEESGLPPEVERAFSTNSTFAGAQLLMAVPEHRVWLDSEERPSQNDIWAMLLLADGYASVAVEAKSREDFDKPIDEWQNNKSEGKKNRLLFLTETLGLQQQPPGYIRYQLIHRTASAILEAERWRVGVALMLVQSFGESPTGWSDYCRFTELLGISPTRNAISGERAIGQIRLYLGWVDSPMADDATAAMAT